jgi:hypothetical protein
MFDASVTGTWRCPEEIPAIISKLGFWPGGISAQRIRDAQQAFCDKDSRSACVNMNDTSRFYHYDPISFLIGGHRMANAYLRLKSTQLSFICPTPTSTPTTRRPTSKPTRRPTTFKPTRRPTSKPSTRRPTFKPTKRRPTSRPTTHRPTSKPTRRPTSKPTRQPTTSQPTTVQPTSESTRQPTTSQPTTIKPTSIPTHLPTSQPT